LKNPMCIKTLYSIKHNPEATRALLELVVLKVTNAIHKHEYFVNYFSAK
jgi:hypothetical protein